MESTKISKGAVVYALVAPDSEVVDELKKQEHVCKTFADTLSLKVLKSFCDVGNAANIQRPGFQALLSYCEENAEKIGAIIITKPECLMIDDLDYWELDEMLEEYGIEIFSVCDQAEQI